MHNWQEQFPERVSALNDMPIRIKTAKPYSSDSLVMCIRKGKLFCVSQDFTDEDGHYLALPFEEVLKRIECTPETEHLKLSPDFWQAYNLLKKEADNFSYRQSQLSNSEKAYNFLSYLLEKNWNRNDNQHIFLSHRYNIGFNRKVKMTDEEIKAKKFALESAKENKAKKEKEKVPPKRKRNFLLHFKY